MDRKIIVLAMILLQVLYCRAQTTPVRSGAELRSRANNQATTSNRGYLRYNPFRQSRYSGCPETPPGARRRLSQAPSEGYPKDGVLYYYYTSSCELLSDQECEFCVSSISPDTTMYTGDFPLEADSIVAEDGTSLNYATCAVYDMTNLHAGANCYLCLLRP